VSTLHLHIDGPQGEIALESYVRLLNRSMLILRATDSAVTGRRTGALDWVVVDLASDDGLDATIRSKPRKPSEADERTDRRVAASYVQALEVAERGDALPPHLSDKALEQLVHLAKGLRRNGAEALRTTYVEQSSEATVSPVTAENIQRLRVPRSTAIGSIIGRLEIVSVHRANEYSVYDDVTRRPVRCQFKDEELAKVTAVLGRRVKVAGIIHRNTKGQPLRADQPRLTLMPAGDELPTTDEFVGVDRDFTSGESTEEHLRRLRDA
jgi:hypothetical protein